MNTIDLPMSGKWLPEAEALLDEHHVVAVSDDPAARLRFGAHLFQQTQRMVDAQVCPIYGRYVRSLADVGRMVSLSVPVDEPVAPTLEAITEVLRHRFHQHTRRRFIIWHEAHRFAALEPDLFWQVIDVLMGVAAEHEYASGDKLLLTRCVFTGEAGLADFAGFRGWWPEGDDQPLWQVVTGQETPPVLGVRLQ